MPEAGIGVDRGDLAAALHHINMRLTYCDQTIFVGDVNQIFFRSHSIGIYFYFGIILDILIALLSKAGSNFDAQFIHICDWIKYLASAALQHPQS